MNGMPTLVPNHNLCIMLSYLLTRESAGLGGVIRGGFGDIQIRILLTRREV